MLLTVQQFKTIAPKAPTPELITNWLNLYCPQYGINTANIFHEFIANVLHESAQFTILSENLNYTPQALRSTFGRHRITDKQCVDLGRMPSRPANQRAIANILYGGKFGRENLGNIHPDDGWVFRGRGPIQLTGRANITNFARYIKWPGIPEMLAEKLRTDIELGVQSSCWIFAISMKLIDEAAADNMAAVVRRINGGTIGMDDRMKYYEISKRIIK